MQQKSNFDSPLREVDRQRGIRMRDKCGGIETACKAMSYLRRPTKSKLKLMNVQVTTILRARRAPPQNAPIMDITKMIAESWTERKRPSSILDTGYSGTNVITPRDAERAGLPKLGPSNKLILDANGGISQGAGRTRVWRQGLPPEAGDRIIAPQIQHSLTGGTAFADQGLMIIFHPHSEGVTVHWQEDVNIKYTGDPVVIGYCEQAGHGFWRVAIKAPKGATQAQRNKSAPRVNKPTRKSQEALLTRHGISRLSPIGRLLSHHPLKPQPPK